ncbi:MAG: tRNA (adenosine(37)-N6)-dimethylallyltransferase MiaA [Candidatus Caenarcaniphilales bacterium]|nr:tRNA (adenosine(37)-N6)-dimethylallyltransferase MiaA [Candidatus Caenarcaniphilales bacterium]
MSSKREVIAIVGATATGKSTLSIRLAEKLSSEILSADSRLIYRGMDIGTAKPTLQEQIIAKHHLIDLIYPDQDFSLGAYLRLAEPLLENLLCAGKIPIVAGGTGFYLRGLLEDFCLTDTPPDQDFREGLKDISTADLYLHLQNPGWKIHATDRARIIRALELERAGHLPQKNSKKRDFTVKWYGLKYEKLEHQHRAIRQRVEAMIKAGLIEETQSLTAKYGELVLFEKTIGYKETLSYLRGDTSSIDDLIEAICISTNQYRKRQNTWFRANKAIQWLSAEEPNLAFACSM